MARPWAPDRSWLCDDPIADTAEAGRLGRAAEVDHLIGLVQTLAAAPAEHPDTPGSATAG